MLMRHAFAPGEMTAPRACLSRKRKCSESDWQNDAEITAPISRWSPAGARREILARR